MCSRRVLYTKHRYLGSYIPTLRMTNQISIHANFKFSANLIYSVSAYAIPLNPSMLFIFSIAFGRLRFLYQWPDMFGYKSAVFLFWHRQSVFSYTILTSNAGYVICKGHLWRSLLLADGLAAV